MLRAVAVAIASRSRLVTSVARTRRSLDALDAALPAGAGRHLLLALDWSRPDEYLERIEKHLRAVGRPDLVVAWIHSDHLALDLVGRLEAAGAECDVFHVVGSAHDDPLRLADTLRAEVGPLAAVRYHQVVLGARRVARGRRWLSDEEITDGVLDAVARGAATSVIGDAQEPV